MAHAFTPCRLRPVDKKLSSSSDKMQMGDRVEALGFKQLFTLRSHQANAAIGLRAADNDLLIAKASITPAEKSDADAGTLGSSGSEFSEFSTERRQRRESAPSMATPRKRLVVFGKLCNLRARFVYAYSLPAVLGTAEVAVHPRLTVSPGILLCDAPNQLLSVILAARGTARRNSIRWSVQLVPALDVASVELREAVANGAWVAKATVPTSDSVLAKTLSMVMLRREFVF